jgi:hypothetical protein
MYPSHVSVTSRDLPNHEGKSIGALFYPTKAPIAQDVGAVTGAVQSYS